MWVWVKVTKNLIRLAPLDLSLHSQVLSDWLVFFPAGLACFLQPGCYDWLPDRACCCSCVDPLSSETAHIQVQVMDRHVCVCVRACECSHEAISCIPLTSYWLFIGKIWLRLLPVGKMIFVITITFWAALFCTHGGRICLRRFLTWINISSLTVCTFWGKYSWTTYLPQGYVFHLCPFLCLVILLVCDQNCTKTVEWISTKHGWRMRLSPE